MNINNKFVFKYSYVYMKTNFHGKYEQCEQLIAFQIPVNWYYTVQLQSNQK